MFPLLSSGCSLGADENQYDNNYKLWMSCNSLSNTECWALSVACKQRRVSLHTSNTYEYSTYLQLTRSKYIYWTFLPFCCKVSAVKAEHLLEQIHFKCFSAAAQSLSLLWICYKVQKNKCVFIGNMELAWKIFIHIYFTIFPLIVLLYGALAIRQLNLGSLRLR